MRKILSIGTFLLTFKVFAVVGDMPKKLIENDNSIEVKIINETKDTIRFFPKFEAPRVKENIKAGWYMSLMDEWSIQPNNVKNEINILPGLAVTIILSSKYKVDPFHFTKAISICDNPYGDCGIAEHSFFIINDKVNPGRFQFLHYGRYYFDEKQFTDVGEFQGVKVIKNNTNNTYEVHVVR